jgi:hypothetical protein
LQRESDLNAKGYSERDEKRILDALGRGLLKEFPNPDRAGCPGPEVLRKIASHEMPLPEAEKWLDHLTSCSPCYNDFSQFQAAYQRRRTRTLLAIAASILVVAGIGGWVLLRRHNQALEHQIAVLDLRNRSVPRDAEPNPAEPLEVSRAATQLLIYLPLGSSEGPYDVRIISPSGHPLLTTSANAELNGGVTSVRVMANVSFARPGRYSLQLRKVGSEWNLYPILLR